MRLAHISDYRICRAVLCAQMASYAQRRVDDVRQQSLALFRTASVVPDMFKLLIIEMAESRQDGIG